MAMIMSSSSSSMSSSSISSSSSSISTSVTSDRSPNPSSFAVAMHLSSLSVTAIAFSHHPHLPSLRPHFHSSSTSTTPPSPLHNHLHRIVHRTRIPRAAPVCHTGSPDLNEAYVFQPSPFRDHRRHVRTTAVASPSAQYPAAVLNGDRPPPSAPASTSSSASGDALHGATSVSSAAAEVVALRPGMLLSPPDFQFGDHAELMATLRALSNDPLQSHGGRIVTYRGNPAARVVIVGEAPGEQEDELGIPFVGRSGQLLDKIFTYGGFNVDTQVYITNIVKRRPPDNRVPTEDEVNAYLPYLQEELRIVDPVIIILAGNVASRAFLGSQVRISKVRGMWLGGQDGEPWVMPIFHPSYLLRKESMKFKMVTDIEAIREKYMQLLPDDELNPLVKQSA